MVRGARKGTWVLFPYGLLHIVFGLSRKICDLLAHLFAHDPEAHLGVERHCARVGNLHGEAHHWRPDVADAGADASVGNLQQALDQCPSQPNAAVGLPQANAEDAGAAFLDRKSVV